MSGATLLHTSLNGANLTGATVYGTSVWDVETDMQTKQLGLIITPPDEPSVEVDDIEVA